MCTGVQACAGDDNLFGKGRNYVFEVEKLLVDEYSRQMRRKSLETRHVEFDGTASCNESFEDRARCSQKSGETTGVSAAA